MGETQREQEREHQMTAYSGPSTFSGIDSRSMSVVVYRRYVQIKTIERNVVVKVKI